MMSEETQVSRAEREEPLYEQWHVVYTRYAHYAVSGVMARHVEREVARWPRPRWVVFVDLGGARMKVRTALIDSVEQSTPDSRSLWRTIREQWERENGAPNQWDK